MDELNEKRREDQQEENSIDAQSESLNDELDRWNAEVSWGRVEKAAREQQRHEFLTEQYVQGHVDDKHADAAYDQARLTLKETLLMLTEPDGQYAETAKKDPELKQIVDLTREYAKQDVTAISGDYEKEVRTFRDLYSRLDAYMEKQEAIQRQKDSETPENLMRYRIATELTHIIAPQRYGALDPEKEEDKPGMVAVNGVGQSYLTEENEKQRKFPVDQPLFPHDPSPNDISQGYLGDCYLLAGLSVLASRHPEKIKENMRDNQDGTVTVRFFQKQKDEQTGAVTGFSPVLVTVDKIAPTRDGAQGCLWAQMIERAYVASGLHLDHNPDAKPVPADLEAQYQTYLAMPESERPGHDKCPWLFTEDDQLTKWTPDYQMIEAGNAGGFLEQFLGADAPREHRDISLDFRLLQNSGKLFLGGDDALERALYNAWDGKPAEKTEKDTLSSNDVLHALLDIRDPAHKLTVSETKLKAMFTGALSMISPTYGDLIEHHPGEGLSKVLTDMRDFLSGDPAKCPASVRSLLPELNKPDMKEVVDKASAYMNQVYQPLVEKAMLDEPYRGGYPQYMEELARRIDDTNRLGGIVTTGTPGKSDRNEVDGIYERHAYSVLGIEKQKLSPDMPELTFVRVRNPHGRHGREYYVENDKVKQRATENAEGGVFLVELSDFCREFNHVDFTDLEHNLNLNAPQAQQPGNAPAEPEAKFEGDTLKLYAKEMRSAYHDFLETKKGMADFMNTDFSRKLEAEMKETLTVDLYGHMQGNRLSAAASQLTTRAAYDYIRHCEDESKGKPFTGRRAIRAAAANRMLDLKDALDKNYTDPRAYAKDRIADWIYSHLRNTQMEKNPDSEFQETIRNVFENPDYKKASLDAIKASKAFKALTDEASFGDLSGMLHDSAKTYRKFLDLQIKTAEPPKAERAAAAPEKARSRNHGGPQV